MKLKFVSQHPEIEGVITFIFKAPEPINWQPGQYMHYVLPHPEEDNKGTERWFTIPSAPFENHLQITTRFDGERVSSFKQALRNLKPGDEVEADGPEGDFVLREGDHHHVFIAGGIGITPFRSIIAQLNHDNQPINIDLFYANTDANFVFDQELQSVANNQPSFKINKFVGSLIQVADLAPFLKDKKTLFYISGPEHMVEAYEELLLANGADKSVVITDYFPGY